MALAILSECGLRPFPPSPRIPRCLSHAKPSYSLLLRSHSKPADRIKIRASAKKGWALNVSSTVKLSILGEEEEKKIINGGEEEEKKIINGGGEKEDFFDPAAPPSFNIGDIRASIPKHCWVKNPWRSMSYVLRDVVVVFGLAAAAAYLNNWVVWPLYWVAQGTMFWALFVLGHDCGHGSFSNNPKLNSVVGHLLHSSILVPYHGWRISHRTHHQNHGHVENDESWHPLSEKVYKVLDPLSRKLRFTVPFPMFAYPFYLWARSPGKKGSHYNPNSDLFNASERKDVITSTVCWSAMVALLMGLTVVMGPIQMLKLYVAPYWIFVMWLDLVTYLHHHGHEQQLPWYRGKEWSYLRGGLTTLDRDYGLINNIHHDIGTHVIHHLFPQIPHYHLIEATEAAKPVLGKYYREPKKSGPLPFHLIGNLVRSLRQDHYVSDKGDVVYYQMDPQFAGPSAKRRWPGIVAALKEKRKKVILFSDILTPLPGMNIPFDIIKEKGPVIYNPIRTAADVNQVREFIPEEWVPYVGSALTILRSEVNNEADVLGFVGALFTLASYVVEGGSSKHFSKIKSFAFSQPEIPTTRPKSPKLGWNKFSAAVSL